MSIAALALAAELAVLLTPVATAPGLGVEGRLVAGVFGVGGNVAVLADALQPYWSAWGSLGYGPATVFAGAATTMNSLSCPFTPVATCRGGMVPGPPGALVGASWHQELGGWWVEARPTMYLTGPGAFDPLYGLVNGFLAGPAWLELGWHVTPTTSISLRSSVVPLKLALTF
jgi:hypothetical protein